MNATSRAERTKKRKIALTSIDVGRECAVCIGFFYRFHVSLPSLHSLDSVLCVQTRNIHTHDFSFFIDASSLALFIRYWLRVVFFFLLLLLSFAHTHTQHSTAHHRINQYQYGYRIFRAKFTESQAQLNKRRGRMEKKRKNSYVQRST